MKKTSLRFHWSLPIDGEKTRAGMATRSGIADIKSIIEFAQLAEESGIESLLMPFGFHMPDPIPLAAHIVSQTKTVKLLIAYRTGVISPVLFVQQINTLSHFCEGRLAINFIAGTSPKEQAQYGDFSSHDQRIHRAAEFIQVCRSLWETQNPLTFQGEFIQIKEAQLKTPYFDNGRPKVYLSGNSDLSKAVALKHTDGWLRYADSPATIEDSLAPIVKKGLSGGLRLSIIARGSRDEALRCARGIVSSPDAQWTKFIRGVVSESDSIAVKNTFAMGECDQSHWLTPSLWAGAVRYRGGPAVAIVGSYDEVAAQILAFKGAGVTEFIFSGWTNRDELEIFAAHVLPRVRNLEYKGA